MLSLIPHATSFILCAVYLLALFAAVTTLLALGKLRTRHAIEACASGFVGCLVGACLTLSVGCSSSLPSITSDFDKLAKAVCAANDSWQICRDKCAAAEATPSATPSPPPPTAVPIASARGK